VRPNTLLATALAAFALAAPFAAPSAAAAAADPRSEFIEQIEQEQRQNDVFKVFFPDVQMARRAAITFHEQLLESHLDAGYMIIELDADDRARIEAMGFVSERATDWMRARNERLDRLKLTPGASLLGRGAAIAASAESIGGFPCYETVEETLSEAQAFTTQYPQLARVIDIGDSWQKTRGSGGYDLTVLKLSNAQVPGPKPKLFINSAIHAREYTTAPLVLSFARQLLQDWGRNADATWILDHHEIHLLLQTNPDGRKKAETGLSWRKNTNTNYCSAIGSLRGADLNRNFGYSWNLTNGQGSSGNQCDLTYRGPSASSEPETQAVEAYVRGLWPDLRGPGLDDPAPADASGIHLDVHSFSQLVLWPWGVRTAPAPNGDALQAIGRRFAWFNNYSPIQSIGLYPTDGTSDAVSYGELGVPAFTFELGTDFFQSCAVYESTVRPDNLPALMYAAKMVRTPYQTAGGPDVTKVKLSNKAATRGVAAGTPVTITSSATDLRFNNSEGTEPTQNITAAEVYIDTPPWQAGAAAQAMSASDGAFNSKTESLTGTIDTTGLSVGKHLVYVRARDASNTWGPFTASFLKVR
jgi:carboxypeptidase T